MLKGVVNVESVGKKFSRSLGHSMFYGGIDITKNFLVFHQPHFLRKTEFWGVNDISF